MIRWQCPVCQQALALRDRAWVCDSGHTFDLAKEGYANLLLANQKRRPDPGDNKDMILARRAFLAGGGYQPLVAALKLCFAELGPLTQWLDIGCGEGYYARELLKAQADVAASVACIDISRDAVRQAARAALPGQSLAVASSKRLPLAGGQFDAALVIFAPFDAQEVARVLTPKGRLIVVTPGAQHLLALREFIYPDIRPHQPPTAPVGFELERAQQVSFSIAVTGPGQLAQLLAMTPFAYKLSDEQKTQFAAQFTDLTADFVISVYKASAQALAHDAQ
ncbi:methyltransferase domain-containing protein [Simiduia sp. 21SJ11W-1]|uniref:putative RNA methyltransferase n=1 Tax=Simiduia sp. 21SJ11W-1 TaxID=2909669 RepID=UPI0020A0C492|nr:methyltransferase domain-containing protein [Simiduia sp. 21SJ11W-1]UTA46634.1 methyltransferase domain-containing protein [Simiduia sp. 21SJ11W-1]